MFLALTAIFSLLTLAGVGQALAGWRVVRRFVATAPTASVNLPPLTVLKPLHGDEPLLEAALGSVVRQSYPCFQVVFGVQRDDDPAIAVVERLRAQYPECDIALVVDPTPHGANRKVANLINMYAAAKYDHIVIADSDLHCAPDYLRRVAMEFAASCRPFMKSKASATRISSTSVTERAMISARQTCSMTMSLITCATSSKRSQTFSRWS